MSKSFSPKFIKEIESYYPGIHSKRLCEEFSLFKLRESFRSSYSTEHQMLKKFKALLVMGKPLEYINQESFFYESRFYVDERVLIPRSESEILVDLLIQKIRSKKLKRICEIGVGSFCLSLSILLEIDHSVYCYGSDICSEALKVSELNLQRFSTGLSRHKIELDLSDRFTRLLARNNQTFEKFDLIFSNPPYILSSQQDLVHPQVHKFEPHKALYLEDTIHQSWYEKFFQDSLSLLEAGGNLIIEGHEHNLTHLEKIGLKFYKKSQSIKDYNDCLRFLVFS